jgi:uncharacterized protein (TIGR03435 family)
MRCARKIKPNTLWLMTLSVLTLAANFASAPLQSKPTRFAAASIRVIPAGTPIRAEVLGVSCHGSNGVRQTVIAVKPGIDAILGVPQGRCVANGVPLQSLIGFSYGVPERNIVGGPGWIRMSGPTGFDPGTYTLRQTETYAIEAVAENSATATVEELRQMLQAVLTERFTLKFHREIRQSQGYTLVIARAGPKIKEVKSGYESPRTFFDENLRRSIKGTSKLADLLDVLWPAPFGAVVDKTGLTGIYQYEFLAPLPPPPAPAPPPRPAGLTTADVGEPQASSNPISSLSAALETQLGLRFQVSAVAVEVIVIDQVEKPSAN